MILVELTELSYRFGTTLYAQNQVNGTIYGKFSGGFRVINERATKEPQYRGASLEMVSPLAESTPMTQSSQMPEISGRIPPVRDIVELTPNEQVRAEYFGDRNEANG